MSYSPGPAGAPGQEPNPAVDPTSGAVEYPPIEYTPTPPPGFSLPPTAPALPPPVPPTYLPPVGGYPPPGPFPPPGAYPPPVGYGPPPGYPAYGGPYGGQAGTNGMAIASLACSLVALPAYALCFGFALSILGIVLGVVALNQVNQTHQKGKELSIAGIVVGGVGLFGVGVFTAFYF